MSARLTIASVFSGVSLIAIVTNACTAMATEKWERALVGLTPATKKIVEKRCRQDAKENVYSTVEGISSIFLTVEGKHAFQDIFLNTNSSGLSYSTFWFNYGHYAVETDALKFFDSKQNPEQLPVALIKDFKPYFRKTRQSFVTVSYRRESTDEEESLGVYGRTITVTNEKLKTILGTRTEFFWLSPPGFRYGVRHQDAICPHTPQMAKSPEYFVGKVINPITNPCQREFVEKYGSASDKRVEGPLFKDLWACWDRANKALPPRPE